MNNLLLDAKRREGLMKLQAAGVLSSVKSLLSDVENVLTFDNISPAERNEANETYTRLCSFETQLEQFLK